jgi:4-carboxymuconolactone decarboxylase
MTDRSSVADVLGETSSKAENAESIRHAMWGDAHLERVRLLLERDPDLARIVLLEGFGSIYADGSLAPDTRSLATIAALVAEGHPEQLRSHLQAARRLGVGDDQLVGLLRHLFLYLGLPRIIQAHRVLAEIRDDEAVG